MIKKIILVFLIFVVFIQLGFGIKKVIISNLGRPVGLELDRRHLYILENAAVYIYSLKDFSLLKKFGKKGQGPGEFNTLPHVHITLDCSTDRLIIGSNRKISYYSKTGDFIREVKARNLALRLRVLDPTPGKETFLGWSQRAYEGFNYNTIVVFDHELNKVRQVYRAKDPFQGRGKGYDLLPKTFSFLSHRGKILLPGKDDATVEVFDLKLKSLCAIRIQQARLRVSEDFKQKMIQYLKTSPETKNVYPILIPLRFPKYFPVIHSFYADEGRIYVMTWKREKGKNEFFTYSMQGRYLGKKMLPIVYETEIQTYPTRIKDGKLYQLVEDEASQEWELRIVNL